MRRVPADGRFLSLMLDSHDRDALMVSGFDLIGHNRTLQIHWLKRVIAFFLDLVTVFGLIVEGDPRQRWSDKILGTTVAQSHLIHVRVHPLDAADANGR